MTKFHSSLQFILRNDKIKSEMLSRVPNIPVDSARPWVVRVERYYKPRTTAQNARYWPILSEYLERIQHTVDSICQNSGYTPREAKIMLKRSLLNTEFDKYTGFLDVSSTKGMHDILKCVFPMPVDSGEKTSTKMDTKQFTEYTDMMQMDLDNFCDVLSEIERRAGNI